MRSSVPGIRLYARGLRPWLLALGCVLLPTLSSAQRPESLRVVSASPQQEVSSLEQANEIRVVFSEPMVALGRIPERVSAPFVTIRPAIAGTFRWSGTTTLVFTPDPKTPLPFATRYDVTIDASAAAVSGRRLGTPYRFTFTTPTVRLLQTNWYRRGGRAGAPMVILLQFNQPVRREALMPHVSARFTPHDWAPPSIPGGGIAHLKRARPDALKRYDAKVAATRAAASANGPVGLRLTADWDRKQFPETPSLLALETTTEVPPEAWVSVVVGARAPSAAGPAVPGVESLFVIEVERAFFVAGFRCAAECPADDRNALEVLSAVRTEAFAKSVTAFDVTGGGTPVARPAEAPARGGYAMDEGTEFTLEDAGYTRQPPARTYLVTVDESLGSADGQTLGYTWAGTVENWHERAFTSFGDGHGVWERAGGLLLPFYARNVRSVTQWVSRLAVGDLMPTIRRLQSDSGDDIDPGPRFAEPPAGAGTARTLNVTPDRIQSFGLDMKPALGGTGAGLVWAAVREGDPIPRALRMQREAATRATIVQVTNLGISVKDSLQNTLVFVTRLDTGAPVADARVAIVNRENATVWSGLTGADGVAVAPRTPAIRDPERSWRFAFIVTAEKDGDVAYVGSDWNEGISSWEFGLPYNLAQAQPMLRGTVFSDRGVYRPGEEVHFKAILRHNAPDGIRLLPAGTPVYVTMRDSQNWEVDARTIRVTAWSSAEWTVTLPADGNLGAYSVRAVLERDKPQPRKPEDLRPGEVPGEEADEYVEYEKSVRGWFLVAAYRRPDFRVDVTLAPGAALAGEPVKGTATAKYLFGAPMGGRPASWTWTRTPGAPPPAVPDALPDGDRWAFTAFREDIRDEAPLVRREVKTSRAGDFTVELPTKTDAGVPYVYTLEADVEDVSRQHIANRASVTIHPAPWYIGVRLPSYFIDQKAGLRADVVAVTPGGAITSGVPVQLTLTQVHWTSVRRAVGNGFYEWETDRKAVPAGAWTITTSHEPVTHTAPLGQGGYFELEAAATDPSGRVARTRTSFYVLGSGYTAWQRFDHNRIPLVADKPRYRPGDTARIMIQSPWETATALMTVEREGVRFHRQFQLTSTQESVSVPIAEDHIPNVYVSVLLVKGRSGTAEPAGGGASGGPYRVEDASDPGKPAFRLGYVELRVEDRSKRLSVEVTANRQEYRPAASAQVQLLVTDARGAPAASEVTLWAVDYGVLSLTAYRTPDVLGSVYVHKALQVMNSDSRQRIVSRRVLTPKGETEGGGGGMEGDPRRDFRALAFWVGSVVTDATGRATVTITLPESLTTYRIMAVAADRASRFGSGEAEVRVNKPLTMKPAFPRFLAVGDTAHFGAVVTSQLASAGTASVTIRSLDPDLLRFDGAAEQRLAVPAGGAVEARFSASAHAIGRARVQMTARIGAESDSFEAVIPVAILSSPETVAAYGEVGGSGTKATETLTMPSGVVPGLGGLRVEMSSTAMVGLGEGARYLVEYPYGCAEQKASSALALVLASDLGDAFSLPGIDVARTRPTAQQTLQQLERLQCADGGFAYWPGQCASDRAYLTSYVLDVFKSAADLKYAVDPGVRPRGLAYLERRLASSPPANESWWPAYTAWQAFAVKVLVEGGRNQDSNLTRLFGYRDRMPVFALAYLHDALLAKGEGGARTEELRRRMANAVLQEGGSAHVEELSDPYLLWFWNSNVRSTAIVLGSLVRARAPSGQVRPLVRWMMAAREGGRWGNTQENAYAMASLVAYYRAYETAAPDFTAVAMLGGDALAREEFRGRSTGATVAEKPIADLLASAPAGQPRAVTFARDGAGTLFYTVRLRYAADERHQKGLDSGITIDRSYAPYVENGSRPAATAYKAGDLVRVTLSLRLTKERRYVAVTDPLPAGFEPLESWFATTARMVRAPEEEGGEEQSWESWWQRGGFDHVQRHDDRVELFATRLAEGRHEFSYVVRATTAGTFRTAPARAEEMYEPEVSGRTATSTISVAR